METSELFQLLRDAVSGNVEVEELTNFINDLEELAEKHPQF